MKYQRMNCILCIGKWTRTHQRHQRVSSQVTSDEKWTNRHQYCIKWQTVRLIRFGCLVSTIVWNNICEWFTAKHSLLKVRYAMCSMVWTLRPCNSGIVYRIDHAGEKEAFVKTFPQIIANYWQIFSSEIWLVLYCSLFTTK